MEGEDIRNKICLEDDRPQDFQVQIVTEISRRPMSGDFLDWRSFYLRPHGHESNVRDHLCFVPLDVIEKLGNLRRYEYQSNKRKMTLTNGQECVWDIHAHVYGVSNESQIGQIAPAGTHL